MIRHRLPEERTERSRTTASAGSEATWIPTSVRVRSDRRDGNCESYRRVDRLSGTLGELVTPSGVSSVDCDCELLSPSHSVCVSGRQLAPFMDCPSPKFQPQV